jgi:hypothetical protein
MVEKTRKPWNLGEAQCPLLKELANNCADSLGVVDRFDGSGFNVRSGSFAEVAACDLDVRYHR